MAGALWPRTMRAARPWRRMRSSRTKAHTGLRLEIRADPQGERCLPDTALAGSTPGGGSDDEVPPVLVNIDHGPGGAPPEGVHICRRSPDYS